MCNGKINESSDRAGQNLFTFTISGHLLLSFPKQEIIHNNHILYQGEVLTVGDCIEFLNILIENSSCPSEQFIKPPAIKRIYASRACRGIHPYDYILSGNILV